MIRFSICVEETLVHLGGCLVKVGLKRYKWGERTQIEGGVDDVLFFVFHTRWENSRKDSV